MAKWCPITGEKVLYLECLECDDKICKNPKQEKQTNRKSSNFTVLFFVFIFHI